MEDGGGMDLTKPTSSGSAQESASTDSYMDDHLKSTRTCTHTHTCNPPVPGSSVHTHTCYHTHTQLISSETNTNNNKYDSPVAVRKRSLGNREAVRKYREKKKAHAAYLEEEVRKLRVLNQQLGRKLQLRAVLETEVIRLRGLLADLNRRIDSELGLFPFQKHSSNSSKNNNNNTTGGVISFKEGLESEAVQSSNGSAAGGGGQFCERNASCFHPGVSGTSFLPGCIEKSVISWEKDCQNLPLPADHREVADRTSTGGGGSSVIAPEAFASSMKPS